MASPKRYDLDDMLKRHEKLVEAEETAGKVFQEKHSVLQFQKRMTANREYLSLARKQELPEDQYVYLGGFFVKLPAKQAQKIVQQDQSRLKTWETKARSTIKKNVAKLQSILPSERPPAVVDLLTKETKSL
uniref:P53 and DNA damage-regulated protein 1 n=1 Tax=Lotharella globosa TaxID=91324 RepID=A0A7S3YL71_9EUKA